MILINSEIFVHMEKGHLAPIHFADSQKLFQKLNLRIAGGQNCSGTALLGDCVTKVIVDFCGCCAGHVVLGGKYVHRKGVDIK